MSEQIRLGDLLTRAGLLRAEDLREGMLIAKQQSLPVGRVLIMAEFISEPNLQAAVQAQSMLKDGVIDIDTALSALQISARGNLSLDEALNQCGWKDKSGSATNKLGGVLTEAGLISKEQLEQGLNQCQMSGLPLGRVLVAMGFMTESLLAAALNAQILIRDSKIQRDLAIQGLRACHDRQISIEQSLRDAGLLQIPVQDTVRLGELFVMANLLNQENLMQAVELGLTESKPIGQVLVENQLVTEQMLEDALSVQRLVAEGKLKKDQSGEVLATMGSQGITIEEAVKRLEPPKPNTASGLPLYQFLQLAGLINAKDIEEALKQGSRDTELMGRMLLLTGAIDTSSLTSAIRLNEMVTNNVLKAEQAILAMGLCQNRNCSVEQAFKSLGWGMALDQAYREQETIPPSAALQNPLGNMQANPAGQAPNTLGQSGTYNSLPQQQAAPTSGHQAQTDHMQSGQYQALDPAASGQFQQLQPAAYGNPNASGQFQSLGSTGQHATIDQTGQTGQHDAYGQTGQHQAIGQTGQHDAYGQTGQHQAIGQTGQHDAYGQTGSHDAYGQTGQHAAVQQTGQNNVAQTGQHDVLGASGQYQALGRQGDIDFTNASQTATSDVPVISADSLLLQQTPIPTPFDEQPPAQESATEAEQDDDDDKKKKGGGGKKRLADLMP
ncbi:hypothetical protein KF707_14755 [Candidatus Obscuribacterales bacterium]|nr:hypothetical protein [Candidatus Obscuribacterales bacterium]